MITGLISVVVPAYNEAPLIQKTLTSLAEVLSANFSSYEVIVVDDGSSDETSTMAAEATASNPAFQILSYHPNRGKGYALRHGFSFTKGDVVVFYDADLDIDPECIPLLVRQMEDSSFDVIVASKMHPQSQVSYPLLRRFFSRCFFVLVWALLQIPVKDTQVGLKVFRRQVLETVMPFPQVNGFAFDVEVLALVQKAGYRMAEGPVRIQYEGSTSHVTPAAVLQAVKDTFGVFYRTKVGKARSLNGQR